MKLSHKPLLSAPPLFRAGGISPRKKRAGKVDKLHRKLAGIYYAFPIEEEYVVVYLKIFICTLKTCSLYFNIVLMKTANGF